MPGRMDCHWRVVKATTSFQLITHASCKGAIRVLFANTEINDCLIGSFTGSRGYAEWVSTESSLLLSSPKVDEIFAVSKVAPPKCLQPLLKEHGLWLGDWKTFSIVFLVIFQSVSSNFIQTRKRKPSFDIWQWLLLSAMRKHLGQNPPGGDFLRTRLHHTVKRSTQKKLSLDKLSQRELNYLSDLYFLLHNIILQSSRLIYTVSP